MSSRERKRADRRKRKERSTGAAGGDDSRADATGSYSDSVDGSTNGAPRNVEDLAAEADAHGLSRSELRNEQAREDLEPLAEGERPGVVTIGALVSLAIAASIIIGYLAGFKVDVENSTVDERPNPFQVFPPALLFAVMGWGMWRSRYWAVLGFEAIMAIIMVGSFITLIAATSVFKAISAAAVLIGAGLLFWFTVKALARIQMPELSDR